MYMTIVNPHNNPCVVKSYCSHLTENGAENQEKCYTIINGNNKKYNN